MKICHRNSWKTQSERERQKALNNKIAFIIKFMFGKLCFFASSSFEWVKQSKNFIVVDAAAVFGKLLLNVDEKRNKLKPKNFTIVWWLFYLRKFAEFWFCLNVLRLKILKAKFIVGLTAFSNFCWYESWYFKNKFSNQRIFSFYVQSSDFGIKINKSF